MASNDARGMGMDGRRISSNEEDYVQEGDSSEDFGEHYRGSAVIPASEPSPERPPVVRTSIGMLGEALYPPLQIVEMPSENNSIVQDNPLINLDFFMIPDTFNETFKSRWKAEDLSHGRINPIHNYGGTQREISLSFTLAAFTVAESRSNLSVCQDLARTVYGRYRRMERTVTEATADADAVTRVNTIFGGHKEFRVDFGGLIRDERAFISKFAFTADMEAGVFDYSSGVDTDVTHATPGVILPRAVKIEIGFTIVHDRLLGFGGQNRPGKPLHWAHNPVGINRDWPHGTGQIGVQEYMSKTTKQNLASLPRVVRPSDDDYDNPLADRMDIYSLSEEAISGAATRLRVQTARRASNVTSDASWRLAVILAGTADDATEEEKQLFRDVQWVRENPE
tara:strand:+ start:197 stop:1381 length:1185 start_codon:yes stop_codon:yes gene_type:complete